jgi:hypothetical protein
MTSPVIEAVGNQVCRRRKLRTSAGYLAGILICMTFLAPDVRAMTAGEWLDKCKIFLAIQAGEPIRAGTATKRTLQTCSLTAATVWCTESYVVIGAKLDLPPGRAREIADALSKACPHPLTQSHPVRYALEYWQQRELPQARRRQPASGILSEAFRKRWPRCLSTRRQLNALAPRQALPHCIRFHTPAWRL